MQVSQDVRASQAARIAHSAWSAIAPTMSEKAFMQALIGAARELGWLAYHPFDSRHSAAGFPDLTLVRGDRLVFIECKREGRDLTLAQVMWCDALERAGAAVYRPVRPSDYDAMIEVLAGVPATAQPAGRGEEGVTITLTEVQA